MAWLDKYSNKTPKAQFGETMFKSPSMVDYEQPSDELINDDYDMERALELGYTPDETGHWPSVDYETGQWLKSKKHHTRGMELMAYELNPELHNAYNLIENEKGKMQYIPKGKNGIEGTMGGLTDKGFNYNGAWGGQFQNGGYKEKIKKKEKNLLKEYVDPVKKRAMARAKQQGINTGLHNGPLDAIRHSSSAAAVSSALPTWTNFIPGVAPLKILASNVAGAAHELNAPNSWKEHASDLYNNFIGSVVGVLPVSEKNKHNLLIQAQKHGVLSDMGDRTPARKKPIPNTVPKGQDGMDVFENLRKQPIRQYETYGDDDEFGHNDAATNLNTFNPHYTRSGKGEVEPAKLETTNLQQYGSFDSEPYMRSLESSNNPYMEYNVMPIYNNPLYNRRQLEDVYYFEDDNDDEDVETTSSSYRNYVPKNPVKYDANPILNKPYASLEEKKKALWNISQKNTRLQGRGGYYDGMNITTDDPEQVKRAIQKSEEYNEYINKKYGNSTNPKALERAKTLRNDVEVTPMFQDEDEDIWAYEGKKGMLAKMGASIPGSVGFTYARTQGIPSEGPYAKKTLPSAQNGREMSYYQHGLDFTPKGMQNGGWLDAYGNNVPKAQDSGKLNTPEAWEKSIRDVEHEIGDPNEWTMDSYNKLQNKLNEYKNWRENTKEGRAVIDYHNEPNEYVVPLPMHLRDKNTLKFLEPTSPKLPKGYVIPYNTPSSELATSIGGENGEPAFLVPSFKYGQLLEDPYKEFLRTGEHLGGPFKTWQEADEWERDVRHPYVEKGQDIPTPLRRWGKDFANGGIIKDDRGQWAHPGEITKIGSNQITMQGVPYPVLGISDTGDVKMMYPGEDYEFDGESVTEFPMARNGINNLDAKPLQKLNQLTNFTNYNRNSQSGWLDKFDEGGTISSEKDISIKEYGAPYPEPQPTKPDVTVAPEELIDPIKPDGGYVVSKGDTLSKIAKETGVSVRKIAQANNIKDVNKISIGQELVIPSNTVKALPEKYQNWEVIKKKTNDLNKLGDLQKIVKYHERTPDEVYSIVDKKNAKLNIYKGTQLIKSFEIGVGANPGDAQTVTKKVNGKTNWDSGNKSTGAGIYTISNIDPASDEYYGLPSFNLKNEQGIEVATSIHGTPTARRKYFNNNTVTDNRMSNGCINGKCQDLPEMYKYLEEGSKVYILPEDKGNRFEIVDGKPAFRVDPKNAKKYETYVDKKGVKHKGQGVNRSTNTLVYKPIKAVFNEEKFKDEVFTTFDFNDEKEYNKTTKPFVRSLTDNKQKIMKAAQIPSDVYNEIAKMAFGIYGTESNFGDTHSALGNFNRAIGKAIAPKSSSSPDYESKYNTYGADEDYRSVGLTQVRWSYLNDKEKSVLKKLGITSNKDMLDPKKAAIATTAILGVRYNEQLNSEQKKDIWKYLPTKWNKRGNYAERVKSNSSYLNFQQLNPIINKKK